MSLTHIMDIGRSTERAQVIAADGASNADLRRVQSLVGVLEGLRASDWRRLVTGLAVPIHFATEEGRLSGIQPHEIWDRLRPSFAQAPAPWSSFAKSELHLEACIDLIDTWRLMDDIGLRLASTPPPLGLVVDDRPRFVMGDPLWMISADAWGGSLKLPTRSGPEASISLLIKLLTGSLGGLDQRALQVIEQCETSVATPPLVRAALERLGSQLRGLRSPQMIETVLRRAYEGRLARVLQREIDSHQDVALKVLKQRVIDACRSQIEIEGGIEARSGGNRKVHERRARNSKEFHLDLTPEGVGVVETPEPLDIERRFVIGDSDWVMRKADRAELDLSDLQVVEIVHLSAREKLAALEQPSLSLGVAVWNTSKGLWRVKAQVSPTTESLPTHVRIKAVSLFTDNQYDLPLVRTNDGLARHCEMSLMVSADSLVEFTSAWLWQREGIHLAGEESHRFSLTSPPRPSPLREALIDLAGGDAASDEEVQASVSALRRRVAWRSAAAALLVLCVWLVLTRGPDLLDWVWEWISSAIGREGDSPSLDVNANAQPLTVEPESWT